MQSSATPPPGSYTTRCWKFVNSPATAFGFVVKSWGLIRSQIHPKAFRASEERLQPLLEKEHGHAKSDQAVMQIQSLVKYLSRRGVLSMLVVANHGLLGHNVTSDIDVSFLGDAVLLLRMYEWPGAIRHSITVVKKRHGPHDLNVRELLIMPEGVSVQSFNPPPLGPSGPIPNDRA